ncbi:protein SOSEKI 5 [Castanea sativa]|uniref:protein SOSEKI 5 n=1 Tax=Castanea sativa TaxID=21020 RepID=UPI003F64D3DD
MAVAAARGKATELQIPKKWRDRSECSPERTKVWTEPRANKTSEKRSVPVVYYLSRNGQLEHPHFIEVPLSSPEGLYLRDVINRLNLLRGKGMANLYSWSSKRSYKNGFVWHDLSENDFIYPAHGQEYVLKGSEFHELNLSPKLHETMTPSTSSSSSRSLRPPPPETNKSGEDSDFPAVITRRRNQSWSSIDLHEYKVYKAESSSGESAGKAAADASTQTEDKRRRRRPVRAKEIEEEEEDDEQVRDEKSQRDICHGQSTELSRDEISPPPSDSSPETLESLMKADGRLVICQPGANEENSSLNRTAENFPSGRMKASTVLMQLISCGSISFKDCGATSVKDQGFSMIGHYKSRLPRGAGNNNQLGKEAGALTEIPNFPGLKLEDKEYFSGSLIETNKKDVEVPNLKRSSSYNADRSSQLQLADEEIEGVRTKCMPRKPKTQPTKKDCNNDGSFISSSSSQQGSKRIEF